MIVIDTNVVSELMRAYPEQAVSAWFAGQFERIADGGSVGGLAGGDAEDVDDDHPLA